MVTQRTRLVVPLMLCALLAPPAIAQEEGGFEGSPTDFLPLEVGNQWTYKHLYFNEVYGTHAIFFDYAYDLEFFDPLVLLMDRLTMEIPGYPLPPGLADSVHPPRDLRAPGPRELTLEITHTETIEGHTYFVFSQPAYDWPPVPTLCLAGQKVRFSDEGILLIRQQEQDIPLYNFAPPYESYEHGVYTVYHPYSDKEYTTPAYPVLYDAHDPVRLSLYVLRNSWDARLRIYRHLVNPSPPLSFGPAFFTRFMVTPILGNVYFLANYGLAGYGIDRPGWDSGTIFANDLQPVSAVIGGKKIVYDVHWDVYWETSVQPTSWGQLKARHGQRP